MRKITITATSFYLGIAALVYLLRPGSTRFMTVFGDTLPIFAAGFAAVTALIVASRFDYKETHGAPWTFLGFGMLLWFFGEFSWWIIEVALKRDVPFPSIADAFWLSGYVPLFIGLYLSFKQLNIRLPKSSYALALLALATAASASFIFVLSTIVTGKDTLLNEPPCSLLQGGSLKFVILRIEASE